MNEQRNNCTGAISSPERPMKDLVASESCDKIHVNIRDSHLDILQTHFSQWDLVEASRKVNNNSFFHTECRVIWPLRALGHGCQRGTARSCVLELFSAFCTTFWMAAACTIGLFVNHYKGAKLGPWAKDLFLDWRGCKARSCSGTTHELLCSYFWQETWQRVLLLQIMSKSLVSVNKQAWVDRYLVKKHVPTA